MENSEALDRRTFLAGLAAGAAAVVSAAPVQAQQVRSRHCFVVESGTRGPAFSVGMLICAEPRVHLAALQRLRRLARFGQKNKWGYWRPIKYGSTDEHKLPFSISAMNYCRDKPDIFLSQVFVPIKYPWPANGAARDSIQLDMYVKMISQIPTSLTGRLTLHVVRRSTDGHDRALNAHVRQRFGNRIPIVEDGGNFADLMGVASLIIGTIGSENTGGGRDRVKSEIRTRLRRCLGVRKLTPPELNRTGKVRMLSLA
jgi:hypothetical protein